MTGTDNNPESRCPTWTTGSKKGVRFGVVSENGKNSTLRRATAFT